MRIRKAQNRITDTSKGFTMVELIVVLVIVAVVAAFLVPALLGFIDKGRESEYKAHAQAALSATQTALSDIYNDGGNSYTPTKRENTRVLAGAPESTAFTIWTDDVLWDGRTVAKEANIGSYTIIKAIYKENDNVYMYYDGANWTKYDTEKDAKKAAVGLNGEDDTDTLGNNVIFVWPYKRDFAYLNEKENDPDPEDSPDGPEIKVVNFHTDKTLLTQAYFKRVGKTGSSVKDTVRVVFWKNGDEINSDYWDGTVFTENENYQYTFFTTPSINFGGWIPDSLDNSAGILDGKDDVINYLYNTPATKDIAEFDLYADLTLTGKVPEVTLGKSEFRSFLDSVGGGVSGIEKVELTDDEITEINSIAESFGATRVDDGSNRIAYLYAWMDGNTVKWCTNALVAYMPEDCSEFFKYSSGGGHILNLNFDEFEASRVTDTSEMFSGCSSLESILLGSHFASAKITDVSNMFYNCSALTSVDVEDIGTGSLTSVTGMFSGCSSLGIEIGFSDTFDTSSITSFENMFLNCGATGINAAQLDTSSAVSLKNMFKGCSSLGTLNLSSWNLSNVTTMEGTFKDCSSLNSITVSGLSLGNCSSLKETFSGCSSLGIIDIDGMGLTANLTNMHGTFYGCSALSGITFPESFDTTSITDMGDMLNGCSGITELDLMMFDTANVTNFAGMFNEMTALTTINASKRFVVSPSAATDSMFENDINLTGGRTQYSTGLPDYNSSKYACIDMGTKKPGYFKGKFFTATLSKSLFKTFMNVSKVTDMVNVEYDEDVIQSLGQSVSKVDDGSVDGAAIYAWREGTVVKWCTNAEVAYMPSDCSDFFNGNTKIEKFSFVGFDTSNITTMKQMFLDCTSIKEIVLGEDFDGGKVTNMYKAFRNCKNMVSIDVENWGDTSSFTNLEHTFNRCEKLKSINVSDWDVSNVTSIEDMFSRCYALESIDISEWDVSKVTSMRSLFKDDGILKTVDLSGWDTSSLVTIQQMFNNCKGMTSVNLEGWDVSNLKCSYAVFLSCSNLETINISGWEATSVTNVSNMFNGCSKLTEIDLSLWDTSKVNNVKDNNDISTTCFNSMFSGCTKLTTIYGPEEFVFANSANTSNIFLNCNLLEGDHGTKYSTSGNGNKSVFARLDKPDENKAGYFSVKPNN